MATPVTPAKLRRRLRTASKLNLCLHIVGRRSDGWHRLESVVDPIDWGDELYLRRRRDGRIVRRHGLRSILPEHDLSVRAARLLQEASACPFGVDISLRKRVPHGAGLGGGSGDAALVLSTLNILWRLHWSHQRLATLALALGADVPVLLRSGASLVEGVGEWIRPLELESRHYVVVFPAYPLATPRMYQDARLERDAPSLRDVAGNIVMTTHNSFQSLATALEPEIEKALLYLRQEGLDHARLTGSGSAVFAECRDRAQAQRIARRCPRPWTAHAVRSRR